MTACVNKKSKRVAAVVTASLVGALSIGAPAVAMAAGSGDIQLLVSDEANAFTSGKIEGYTLDGKKWTTGVSLSVDTKFDDSNVPTVVANGEPVKVQVGNLVPANGDQMITGMELKDAYKQTYVKANSKGKPGEAVDKIVDPGNYFVKVEAVDGKYEGGVVYLPVKVTAASLGSLSAFEVNPANAKDTDDTAFVFNGSELNIGIKNGTKTLVEGVDYEVKFLADGDSASDPAVEVKNVGKYWAVVNGLGMYAGETANLASFTVTAFDLSNSDVVVTVDPVIGESTYANASYTVTYTDDSDRVTTLDNSYTKLVLENGVFGANTEYTNFKVTDADTTDGNVINFNSDFSVKKFAKAATFKYDGEAWSDTFKTVVADEDSARFDVDKIVAYDEDGKKLDKSDLTVKVYNASGAEVKDSGWNEKAGTYTVKAVYEGSDYKYGGSVTCKVTVVADVIDADAKVYVKFGDDTVDAVTVDWTGEDIKDMFSVVVTDNDNETVKSDKYTVEYKDASGKAVDEFSDAGEYTIEIKSSDYELTGTTVVKVTINKLDLTDLVLNEEGKFNYVYLNVKDADVVLNSSKILYAQGVDTDDDGELNDLATIPSGCDVKLQREQKDGTWKDVKKAAEGETAHYRAIVTAGTAAIEKNCDFASENGTVVDFWAADGDKFTFADVKPSDWFFDVVASASHNGNGTGLMNGYAGTKLFGSTDQLTRGQVACVLFNMAGGESIDFGGDWYNDLVGWKSFDDVDGKAYYGKAISWAKQAGVVNGYADGTFRPDANVTREEFAAMLANFAKKYNAFVDVDADKVLGEFSDGASVSDWAEEVVAWAVDSEIMGNGGFIAPTAQITRAEAAAMVINSKLAL